MSTWKVCHRCDGRILGDVYRVRITLCDAHPAAPKEHTDITEDFHPECAAWLFRAFVGRESDLEPPA